MDAEDARVLSLIVPRLRHLLETADQVVPDAVEQPVAGSLKGQAHRSGLHDAYDYVGAVMFSAEDHLRAMLLILTTGPVPTYALYSLLRSAAEAIVRTRHLLDLDISETQRLARGLNERLDNLNEQVKISRETLQEHYDERVAHLEARARSNSIEVRRGRAVSGGSGKVIWFGEPLPTDFDLATRYLYEGATLYRILCGHVHSKPWVQLPSSAATPSADPKVALVNAGLNVPAFATLLDVVLDLYEACNSYWLVLAGYPSNLFELALGASSTPPDKRGF